MGLFDRARLAWAIVMQGEHKALQLVPTWEVGKPKMPPVDYMSLAQEGYAKNELVYACIRQIAHSAAEPKYKVMINEDEEAGPDHPLVKLLDRPNEQMSLNNLIEATLTMELIGGDAFWEKERAGVGLPVALWPMRPDRVRIVPGNTAPAGFIYKVGVYEKTFKPQDVIHFRWYDPRNDWFGLSPLAVASRAADADNERTDFVRAFFANAAVPYGLFTTKIKMTKAEVKRIKQEWKEQYGGTKGWSNMAVLDADAEYQQLGLSMADMAFPELTQLSETRICMTFGVPPILIGADVGLERSTYSNTEQARKLFWEDTMLPIVRNFEAMINVMLAEEFDCKIVADLSEIKVLQEDRNAMWERANLGVSSGWVTVNEAREEAGFDTIEGQDIFLRDANLVVVGETENPLALRDAEQVRKDEEQIRKDDLAQQVVDGKVEAANKPVEEGKPKPKPKPKSMEGRAVRSAVLLGTKNVRKAIKTGTLDKLYDDLAQEIMAVKRDLQSDEINVNIIMDEIRHGIAHEWTASMIDRAIDDLYKEQADGTQDSIVQA